MDAVVGTGVVPPPPHVGAARRIPGQRHSRCKYEGRHLPCNPCRWWNLGMCTKKDRCKFCHIPMPTREPEPTLAEFSPQEESEFLALRSLLTPEQFAACKEHVDLASRLPGGAVLCKEHVAAYLASFAEARPFGENGEFNPRIFDSQRLIDDVSQFWNLAASRTASLNAQLWQSGLGRELHQAFGDRLRDAASCQEIQAVVEQVQAATEEMAAATARARRFRSLDLNDKDVAALEEVQSRYLAVMERSKQSMEEFPRQT